MNNKTKLIIASAFGLGLLPLAPGSFAALVGLLYTFLVIFFLPSKLHIVFLSVFLLINVIFCLYLNSWAEEYWQDKDSSHFVLDEIIGYLIVPILFHDYSLKSLLLGFFLFRIFDIIKLPGARIIDKKMKNAYGVILDDVVSALYAVAFLYTLQWMTN